MTVHLKDFFKFYNPALQHHQDAIEQLEGMMHPALKRDDSPWVVTWRNPPVSTKTGVVNADLLSRVTNYPAESFDDDFCADFNKLIEATGFSKNLTAFRILLAQMLHETVGFKYMKEIGDDAYFTRMYEGRCGDLGNCHPGDGKKYPGSSAIQITGRHNFQRASDYLRDNLGIDDPKIMELGTSYTANKYPFLLCYAWIIDNNYLEVCQTGDIKYSTKVLNGGYNGFDDRVAKYEICKREIVKL